MSENSTPQEATNPGRTPQPRHQVIEATYSGPLPPASELEKYDKIIPGAAERILKMAESEQKHRHELMDKSFSLDELGTTESIRVIKRGQALGAVLAFMALGASVYATYRGAYYLAGAIGVTTVLGLVGAFVLGKKTASDEDEE